MKKALLVLITCMLVASCKNRDVNPDFTADLVGKYVYNYHPTDSYGFSLNRRTEWIISKIANDTISLQQSESEEVVIPPNGFYDKGYALNYLISDIKLTNSKGFTMDRLIERRNDFGFHYTVRIQMSVKISGTDLIVKGTETFILGNTSFNYEYKFKKQ